MTDVLNLPPTGRNSLFLVMRKYIFHHRKATKFLTIERKTGIFFITERQLYFSPWKDKYISHHGKIISRHRKIKYIFQHESYFFSYRYKYMRCIFLKKKQIEIYFSPDKKKIPFFTYLRIM